MHVLIIGAGTGGLALAHKLKQAGIGVSVFERDLVPNADTGGFRVGISPAGSRALKACVPPDLYDLYAAISARPPCYFNMMDERFAKLLRINLSNCPEDITEGEKNVIRTTLRRVLLRDLEAEVAFGKSFEVYTHNPDGTVTVRFADGSEAVGDVLVGADGSGSPVRRQRLPSARLEDTGLVSFGGKIPATAEARALLSPEMLAGMTMIMAPRGFGAIIHSLDFSAHRADPSIAVRWPDFVSVLDDDSIGWGLWGAKQNFPLDPKALSGEDLRRLGLVITERWAPQMRALIGMTAPSTIHFVNVRTSVPLEPWQSSNVTLLGDAIHTMTPGAGAGANTALRDAALLGDMLIEVSRGEHPLIEAIHTYETEMLRYSKEAVRESRKRMGGAGDAIHKPVIGDVKLALMRAAMRTIDVVPPIKRRLITNITRVRGEN